MSGNVLEANHAPPAIAAIKAAIPAPRNPIAATNAGPLIAAPAMPPIKPPTALPTPAPTPPNALAIPAKIPPPFLLFSSKDAPPLPNRPTICFR